MGCTLFIILFQDVPFRTLDDQEEFSNSYDESSKDDFYENAYRAF
jgi:hypothetical protein